MPNPRTTRGRMLSDEPVPTFAEELRFVPRWSVAAAVASFVTVLYIFWVVVPAHRSHPLPFGLRLYFALSWSALSALYMLMVGYVSRDTARRGMRARLWILICLILPGGIGSVLYFLLRQPLITLCPACASRVQSGFHFCPQCAYALSPSCPNCFSSMGKADRYCVECGYDRTRAAEPARLFAFRD